MHCNKMKLIKVNNYIELSEAIKKMFIDYFIRNDLKSCIDYFNGTIGDKQIMSFASIDFIQDFMKEHSCFFNDHSFNGVNFFKKIRNGKLIKCNFPAFVCDSGIIEQKEIYECENYLSYSTEEYYENNFSLNEVERRMSKNVFVYLGIQEDCPMPIKKTKEEVIDFIKKSSISFNKNNNFNYFFKKNIFVGSGIKINKVLFSNKPINNKFEEIKRIVNIYL